MKEQTPDQNKPNNGKAAAGKKPSNPHTASKTVARVADQQSKPARPFERFAGAASRAAGSTPAFIMAFVLILGWAVTGPVFHYSETWQLVINTGTTIITFLMVFLIQKAQNKDSMAIQLKLNELVAASEFASNRLVDVENLSENDLRIIQQYYHSLSELTKEDESLQQSHSIDEAQQAHLSKLKREKALKN